MRPTSHFGRRTFVAASAIAALQLISIHGQSAPRPKAGNWIPTWATAQQMIRIVPTAQPAAPAAAPSTPSTASPPGTAATSPPPLQTLNNQTVRMTLRTSIGGRRLRVKLSNAFNASRVEIGAAHIALRSTGSGIVPGSDRTLTFGGRAAFKMSPGTVVVSDPVDLTVAPLTDLSVSLYFPGETGPPTTHATGLRPVYISPEGDFAGKPDIPGATVRMSYYWLASVEVDAPKKPALIVAFGDSITDGSRSTPDTNNTWPALLAARLAADKSTSQLAVVNMGIGGNRVLTDGANFAGVSALARLDRDVLSQPGATWLIVLEGINDIGNSSAGNGTSGPLSSEELIWGHQEIIDRARELGIKVVGATLTPYEGASYFREDGEKIRQAVNTWIRTSRAYDAVIDFDAATRDPSNPRRFRPDFDSGDHLHPSDAGYQAMAKAIDLRVFTERK